MNKARLACNAQFQKGKQMGLDEAPRAEPVHRSENDTTQCESDSVDATVDATVPKRSVDPNCVPEPFDPDAACETSVYDVLVPQQFQDCITTAPPTTVSAKRAIRRNVCGECACGCSHKYTEGTIYCTQVLYWVGVECGEECGKEVFLANLQSRISQKRIAGLQKLNQEDYGVDKQWVLLAVVHEYKH